jgi:hypothetical protein
MTHMRRAANAAENNHAPQNGVIQAQRWGTGRQDLSSGPLQDKGLIVLKNRGDDRDAVTAAKLLHELYVNERNEPDVGFVLDVVSDMLEDSLAGLDRVTLDSL